MEHLGTLPYWPLRFDAQGDPDPVLRDRLLEELPGAGVHDLFVFSHGWNNAPATATRLYERFFGLVEPLLPRGDDRRVAVVGVVWPAMAWLDEPIPDFADGGGAAALGDAPASDRELVEALKAVYETPEQQQQLDELAALLEDQPDDPASLQEFHRLLRALVDSDPVQPVAPEDAGEAGMLEEDATEVYGRFLAAQERLAAGEPWAREESPGARLGGFGGPPVDDGGAAGLLDQGKRLWSGAKMALRQATYFTMKRRAGAVGERGLGPVLGRLAEAAPGLRVHLVGHSFGARVVSFALAGLPEDRDTSPVKSLVLLQAAFSHFAFASPLPHDRARSGALAGRASRVDGPLVCCFSVHDSAVGTLYPIASFSSREDAAGRSELAYRWGALGHDGAQAVSAATADVQPVHGRYAYAPGRFLNVDAGDVVRSGRPPSGAHSDIFHPELAWIAVSAAGLGRDGPVTAGSPGSGP